jgi:hypothetical protein
MAGPLPNHVLGPGLGGSGLRQGLSISDFNASRLYCKQNIDLLLFN